MTDDQELNIVGTLGVLKRQWRLVALTFFVVLSLSTLAIFSLKPAYTAGALVLVDPSEKNLLNPSASASNGASDDARIESEVKIVTAETTLLRVIEEAKLLEDPEFGVSVNLRDQIMNLLRLSEPKPVTDEERLSAALSKLRQAIKVSRNGLTFLLTVSATADDPVSAASIANTMANAYIRAQLESKIASTLSAKDIIQERIEDASASVVASEEALDAFISSSISSIVAETGRTDLIVLQNELEDLNANRLQLRTAADEAERSLLAGDWAAVTTTLQSDTLAALDRRQQDLQQQLAAAANGSQEEIDLRAELGKVVADLTSGATVEISGLRSQIATTQARAADLQVQLRSAMLSSDLPPAIVTNIYELQQSAELARSQYQTLLTRLKDLEAQAFLQLPDSRIVSAATVPEDQSFPDVKLLLAVAGLLALVLGIAFAFIREHVVGGFTSDLQLASVLRMPVVSAIPLIRPAKASTDEPLNMSIADLLITAPFSSFSDSIRRLQVGLDQSIRRSSGGMHRDEASVIMIGSANANEGKTTLALSLARAYALSGRKTLLIDCDLRKPSLHAHLGMAPSTRLLEYLGNSAGEAELDSLVVDDRLTKAKVIIGARHTELRGGQVITGEYFGRLLDAARSEYEIVVLDTPPVGAVVDALHLAQHADAVVTITRFGITSQNDARATLHALSDAKRDYSEVIAVLGSVEQSRGANRRKYGDYYTSE